MKKQRPAKTVIDWESLRRRLENPTDGLSPEQAAAALSHRARLLAQPIVERKIADGSLEVTRFAVASEEYAVESRYVREVINPPPITRVPRGPAHLRGITAVRGELLPVFDMAVLLGLPSRDRREVAILMILANGDAPCAVAVDAVSDVATIDPRDLRQTPGMTGPAGNGAVRGVTPDACVLLDAAVILNDPRLLIDQAGE